jgi:hypothetical protein
MMDRVIAGIVGTILVSIIFFFQQRSAKKKFARVKSGDQVTLRVKIRGSQLPYPPKRTKAYISKQADGSILFSQVGGGDRTIALAAPGLTPIRTLSERDGYGQENNNERALIACRDVAGNSVEINILGRNVPALIAMLDPSTPVQQTPVGAVDGDPSSAEVSPTVDSGAVVAGSHHEPDSAYTTRRWAQILLVLPLIAMIALTVMAFTSKTVTGTIVKNYHDGTCDVSYISVWDGTHNVDNVACDAKAPVGGTASFDEVWFLGAGSFSDGGDFAIYVLITLVFMLLAAIPSGVLFVIARRQRRNSALSSLPLHSAISPTGDSVSPVAVDDLASTRVEYPSGTTPATDDAPTPRKFTGPNTYSAISDFITYRAGLEHWTDSAFKPTVKRTWTGAIRQWRPPYGYGLWRSAWPAFIAFFVIFFPVVLGAGVWSDALHLHNAKTAIAVAKVSDPCDTFFLLPPTLYVDFNTPSGPANAAVSAKSCDIGPKVLVEYDVADPGHARLVEGDQTARVVASTLGLLLLGIALTVVLLGWAWRVPWRLLRLRRQSDYSAMRRYVLLNVDNGDELLLLFDVYGDPEPTLGIALIESISQWAPICGTVRLRGSESPEPGQLILPMLDDKPLWPASKAVGIWEDDLADLIDPRSGMLDAVRAELSEPAHQNNDDTDDVDKSH